MKRVFDLSNLSWTVEGHTPYLWLFEKLYGGMGQANQALMLSREMKACKDRFPGCGGVLMWSGHDTFPLAINTSLIDFDGNPKPAAWEVAKVWRKSAAKLHKTKL